MSNATKHPMTEASFFFIRRQGINIQPIDGMAVLMNEQTDVCFAVNRVGARIWSLLEQPKNMEEIVRILRAEFVTTEEQCRSETDNFLQHPVKRNLADCIGGTVVAKVNPPLS